MFIKSFILFFSLWLSALAFAGPMLEINSQAELSKYIKDSEFNGVVLVGKESQVLMKEAYGYTNLETKEPLTISDRLQIGSNSKQFVAASLLKLQEQGLISLDDSLIKYFPSLPDYKNIKIRDILNHTSGISNFTDHEEFWNIVDYNKILTLEEIIEFNSKYSLEFVPTTKWIYSNTGYIIAGKIVEIVTGQSWDRYIQNNFLKPLKMNDSGYEPYFEKVSDVNGYTLNDGKLEIFNQFNLSWALSAGALYSTVDDLFKWTSIYDSSNLLSVESKVLMQTPFLNNYGLGVSIVPYGNDFKISHNGRTPGFCSSLMKLKNSKLSVITLDNIDGSVRGISDLLLDFFSKGKALALKVTPYPVTQDSLQEYVGTYALGKFAFSVYVENEKLLLKPNDGQPAYILKATDKDSFNLEGISGEEFIRNSAGKVTTIKHYQNGGVSLFIKNP